MASSFSSFYKTWALCMAVSLIICTPIALSLEAVWPLVTVAGVGFFWFWRSAAQYVPKLPARYGYANWVTFVRLTLVLLLLAFHSLLSDSQLFTGFLIAIALDGVDGYIARRWNQMSEFGAALDMETDAMLVLGLSWLHVDRETVGLWLLVPGAMRYVYELLLIWLPAGSRTFPPKTVRATFAVIFFLGLITPFVLPTELSRMVLGVSGGLILFSFASAIIYGFGEGRYW